MRITEPAGAFTTGHREGRTAPGSDAGARHEPQREAAARLPVPVRRTESGDRTRPAARLAVASAPLIAQLIATEMGLPQTRHRRMAPVAEALAAYGGSRSHLAAGPSRSRQA